MNEEKWKYNVILLRAKLRHLFLALYPKNMGKVLYAFLTLVTILSLLLCLNFFLHKMIDQHDNVTNLADIKGTFHRQFSEMLTSPISKKLCSVNNNS